MDVASRREQFEKFQPETYVSGICKLEKVEAYLSDWMHNVFSGGNIRGEDLLDVGTGPNVNSVLYASSYFKQIYLSDFATTNTTFLEEWRLGNKKEILKKYFDGAVKREGNIQTATEKEDELRKKVRVLYCDVLQENPILDNEKTVPTKFDAVTTSWCLTTACRNETEFKQALENIVSLVKKGGYLISMNIRNPMGYYEVDGDRFSTFCPDAERLKTLFNTPSMKMLQFDGGDKFIENGLTMYLYNAVIKVV